MPVRLAWMKEKVPVAGFTSVTMPTCPIELDDEREPPKKTYTPNKSIHLF